MGVGIPFAENAPRRFTTVLESYLVSGFLSTSNIRFAIRRLTDNGKVSHEFSVNVIAADWLASQGQSTGLRCAIEAWVVANIFDF